MGLFRKILVFLVITSGIIMLGKLAPRLFPASGSAPSAQAAQGPAAPDSTNALPVLDGDTAAGRWKDRLFVPIARAFGLPDNAVKRRSGYWEIVFPQGRPIHEYALQIEKTCRSGEIAVLRGAELRPSNRSVEYHLEHGGRRIKLRASLGKAFLSGSARLAVVFIELDSLDETQLAALESAPWSKTLVVNPHSPNPVLKKLRYTHERNEVMAELPMEPAAFPYVNPGKHALYIHHGRADVERILAAALDSCRAAGFATRWGDRAIENQPLLDNLFRFTAARGLGFLDLTGSQRSLARQTAAAQNAWCRAGTPFRDDSGVDEELARRAALAGKTGDALFVLPYSPAAFRNLSNSIAANGSRFSHAGLELVPFSALAPQTAAAAENETAAPGAAPSGGK